MDETTKRQQNENQLRGGKYTGAAAMKNTRSGPYVGDPNLMPSPDDTLSPQLRGGSAPAPGMSPGVLAPSFNRERLFRAIEGSYRNLDSFRELNRELVRDYSGSYYDNSGPIGKPKKHRYINLLNQAVDLYQILLAANRPRVMVTTSLLQYKPFAKHFERAINTLGKEIRLEETIRQWVLDAFFCIGIVKTHLADSELIEIEPDVWMDPGSPFASNVSLDNFVYDTSAKKWSEVKFAGDMYRIPFTDAEEMFGEEVMSKHVPSSKGIVSEERVEQISRGEDTDEDEFEPMIDLADIWIPRTNTIETYVVHARHEFKIAGEPLAVEEWTGDETGPYHLLGFNEVPENIMPTSPASHLEMLDNLVNNLMRKSARQAARQKDVHIYTPAGAQSARQVQKADDGEWVEVQSTEDIGVLKQGGVDNSGYAFMLGSMEMFDRMAGNLQAQMGLGAQADTVGQEKLIHGAAGRKEAQMQYVVMAATTRLYRSLGVMLWQDPVKEMIMEIPIQGAAGYSVTAMWEPGDREGNFVDYNFDIDVYSMQHQSPASKVQKMNELIINVYLPMSQLLMQQGGMIDMFELTRKYADLMNLPELNDVVKFTGMIDDEQGDSALAEVPKSPSTTRNYVRHNTGGGQTDPLQESMQMMNNAGQQAAGVMNPQGSVG